VGVVLFLWFVPLWLRRDGRGFALALLGGLAADTALVGLFGSWDSAWSITGWTVALAAVLAGAALWALVRLPGPTGRGARTAGWRPCCPWPGSARRCSCTPWSGRTWAGRRCWEAAPRCRRSAW
jgi:hypothetical protein